MARRRRTRRRRRAGRRTGRQALVLACVLLCAAVVVGIVEVAINLNLLERAVVGFVAKTGYERVGAAMARSHVAQVMLLASLGVFVYAAARASMRR